MFRLVANMLLSFVVMAGMSVGCFASEQIDNGVDSGERASSIIEAFDGLCVQCSEHYENIDHFMDSFGGKEVPQNLTNWDPVMRENNGKAFHFKSDEVEYIVAYVKGGGCSVLVKDLPQKEVLEMIRQLYKAKQAGVLESGIQKQIAYNVGLKGYEGAVIIVTVKKAGTGNEGGIGFVSSSAMAKIQQ
ncbi:hypothetical protein [Pseudodesulfovibrio portus]|uniref:Uncharacterized protein n=1 Tax=Pseudodesulfovibrio portus TaxID=231439 RepID=A0ABM8ATX4_9BACT|nr:hypothetical protein [Pseudodesulfovibrio portus]BDQ34817.1 hypothetical protein JCM14722_23590 [Pseudodesulfovibrio portus]